VNDYSTNSSPPIRGALGVDVNQVNMRAVMESVATQTNLGILSDHAEASIVSANAKQIAAAQEQAPLTFIYSLAIEDTHFTYKEPHL
jgi:hypothetical protein